MRLIWDPRSDILPLIFLCFLYQNDLQPKTLANCDVYIIEPFIFIYILYISSSNGLKHNKYLYV